MYIFKTYTHNTTFDPIFDILKGHKLFIVQPISIVFFFEFQELFWKW